MTAFEFVFVIYALILGLSMVELLAGLGRTLEYKFARNAQHKAFSIGWLTPLFGVFVLLDLISFWVFAWRVRDLISVSTAMVTGVTAFAACYYLAARLVFPSEPEGFTDLDDHFYRVRRVVLGILIVLVFAQWIYLHSQVDLWALITPLSLTTTALLIGLMAAAMITRSDWVNITLLAVLNLRYLVLYLFF
ncbi:MAG: hypothetical protein AAFY07_14110 [Pseudomonadota bacterium]